ncbi:MAG TPA: translation initiation factor IF-2 [Phycisphaerae bacterium]|nr:translation initiation factor IF-2 [Phycisphaerae bacterium]HRY69291.1 translation initiation factor IF-2 [Phycisphaerae bacterium]HSA26609.1 translation initiation factor IF-2 [Phycisphaerae bacterium]
MADKLRVHTLSKELGVTSKAILDKCKLEGVDGITNHMSTVSAGLAETIREWFSGGTHATAVEEAAPVDLDKVRSRRRGGARKSAKGEEAAEHVEAEKGAETALAGSETTVVVPEVAPPTEAPPAVVPAIAAEAPPVVVSEQPAPAVQPDSLAATAPPVTVAAAAPVVETVATAPGDAVAVAAPTPAARTPAHAHPSKAAKPAPPARPAAVIAPAGPQNVPAPAQMKGPRVVGFAKPDVIPRPVPRARPGEPVGTTDDLPEAGEGRGRQGHGRTAARDDEGRKSKVRANPRRTRGSLAEVGERLREWNDRDLLERQERLQEATGRGIHARRAREKAAAHAPGVVAPRKTRAQVTEPILVHQLCAATGIGLNQLFPKLKNEHNLMISRNSVIPTDVAQVVMLDFGVELEVVKPKTELERLKDEFDARERGNLQRRPPVVTMLGHVDHGKTSLLDAIRRTSVASGEAGGITQHIGAYRVERGDLSVTFLDTPGHEAFTAMRARGAHMTDVVVLVVAADDGLMPQTIEAINHAKAAKVAIVVALNKIDLPGVDINKIYGQLSEMGLAPTEWGGDTDVIKTSATTGTGVEALIAHLATLSELLDLKADPTVPARGAVIEAQMQSAVGPVVRMLVQEGTLKRGDYLVSGPAAGRVRMLRDDRGRVLKSAGPGVPVEVAGLDAVPNAGDSFYCVESLQRAKSVAAETGNLRRQEALVQLQKPKTLDDLFQQRESGQIPELNLILRADVQGSVDALVKVLKEIPSEEVKLTFLHTGIGAVSESDVVLAAASGAMVVGFNVAADPTVQRMADAEGVTVRLYRIIYDVADDIRKALEGLLPTESKEESRGKAEVRETFRVSRVGVIAGCLVTDGIVARAHKLRVIRDGQIIVPTADDVKRGRHRAVGSLRRFKDDVREVRSGMECGIRVEDFDDVKPGDVIEAYEVIETARKL